MSGVAAGGGYRVVPAPPRPNQLNGDVGDGDSEDADDHAARYDAGEDRPGRAGAGDFGEAEHGGDTQGAADS